MEEEALKKGSPEYKMHICGLRATHNSAEIERLSTNPTVECGVCGAKANDVEYVCTPAKVYEDEQIA